MSWEADHCPVTEMLSSTCAHCRPATERRRLDALEADMRKAGAVRSREIAPDRNFESGSIVTARYSGGRCAACKVDIREGEHIRLHNGGWCHAACVS